MNAKQKKLIKKVKSEYFNNNSIDDCLLCLSVIKKEEENLIFSFINGVNGKRMKVMDTKTNEKICF